MQSEVSDFIDFLVTKLKNNSSEKKAKFGSGKGMFKIKKILINQLKILKITSNHAPLTYKKHNVISIITLMAHPSPFQ